MSAPTAFSRSALRVLLAAAVTVGAGVAFSTWEVPRPAQESTRIQVTLGPGEAVELTFRGEAGPHQVDLTYGNRQTGLRAFGPTQTALVAVPPVPDTDQLTITVRPGMTVTAERSPEVPPPRVWTPIGLPAALPEPVEVDLPAGAVRAPVDSTDSWGVRATAVPVVAEPSQDGDPLREYFHGDVLLATCWTFGDVVGLNTDGPGPVAHESDVWYQVVGWYDEVGFVPDIHLGRDGEGRRLGLPRC